MTEEGHATVDGKSLFRGQRCAKQEHECVDCGRPIYKGDDYWVRVVLVIDNGSRTVTIRKSCCKEL